MTDYLIPRVQGTSLPAMSKTSDWMGAITMNGVRVFYFPLEYLDVAERVVDFLNGVEDQPAPPPVSPLDLKPGDTVILEGVVTTPGDGDLGRTLDRILNFADGRSTVHMQHTLRVIGHKPGPIQKGDKVDSLIGPGEVIGLDADQVWLKCDNGIRTTVALKDVWRAK